MNEIEVSHALEPSTVEERMLELARRHDITMTASEPGRSGELARKIPFLGSVDARYEIRSDSVVVRVLKAPGSLEGTLRKILVDELGRALA